MSPKSSAPAARAGTSVKAPAEQVVRDIRRATRKHHSAEDKIRIVLEGLRGEESIAALCRREGIAESLYYTWMLLCRVKPCGSPQPAPSACGTDSRRSHGPRSA
jgi:transposase-like protein